MRTTVTLDDAVERRLRQAIRKLNLSFKEALNEALRRGVDQMLAPASTAAPRPFKQKTYAMGLKDGLSYDNVEELLNIAEGEHRR